MLRRFTPASRDLAVDLGTTSTLIYESGSGVVVDAPSVVAVDARSGELLAVGQDARAMLGRAPGRVNVVRPIAAGVISDADAAERMLRYFISTARPARMLRPRMVVCVPSDTTSVERRALEEAALRAGARDVFVIEEAVAAAIGAGLNVHSVAGAMVVDIGGGTTDAAVTSLGGVVCSRALRMGSDAIDEAITTHVKNDYALLVGERTAEDVKTTIGSAFPLSDERTMTVRGRDLISGLPKTVIMTSQEVRRAIEPVILAMCETVRETLDACPPELAGDVLDNGITLTGGAAALPGLDVRMRHELGVEITVSEAGAQAVVLGAGRCVEEFSTMRSLLTASSR